MAMVMVMMRRTVMIGWWSGDDDFSDVDLGGNGYHDADHEDDRDDDHDDEVVVFTGAASFEWSVVMWTAVVCFVFDSCNRCSLVLHVSTETTYRVWGNQGISLHFNQICVASNCFFSPGGFGSLPPRLSGASPCRNDMRTASIQHKTSKIWGMRLAGV